MPEPTPDLLSARARGLLRLLWQDFDAGGESEGRSYRAHLLETAMALYGPPDPAECRAADDDPQAYFAEAQAWVREVKQQALEAHFASPAFNPFDESGAPR